MTHPRGGPAPPLRVALVVPSLMMGGAEHHVVKLCRALDRRKVEPSIVLLRRGLPQELAWLLPGDVPVLVAPVGHRDPRVVPWLAQQLRQREVDVAQSFLWYADAVAAAAALLVPRVRLVCSERGERSMDYHVPIRRAYDRLVTFRRASAIIANSQFGASLLLDLGAPAERTLVIANGLDLDGVLRAPAAPLREKLGWPNECHIVGSVCRLVEGKGVETLIAAVAAARPADVRAVIVGAGPLRPQLERMVEDFGLGDRIAFLGQQTPAVHFFKAFDSFALLSRFTEHSSNSLLEAMACGLPTVATRIGGNVELVRDGETGYLVAPTDPAAVAAALRSFALDPLKARSMGAAGRRHAMDAHDMGRLAERWVALWESTASRV